MLCCASEKEGLIASDATGRRRTSATIFDEEISFEAELAPDARELDKDLKSPPIAVRRTRSLGEAAGAIGAALGLTGLLRAGERQKS